MIESNIYMKSVGRYIDLHDSSFLDVLIRCTDEEFHKFNIDLTEIGQRASTSNELTDAAYVHLVIALYICSRCTSSALSRIATRKSTSDLIQPYIPMLYEKAHRGWNTIVDDGFFRLDSLFGDILEHNMLTSECMDMIAPADFAFIFDRFGLNQALGSTKVKSTSLWYFHTNIINSIHLMSALNIMIGNNNVHNLEDFLTYNSKNDMLNCIITELKLANPNFQCSEKDGVYIVQLN